MSRNVKSGRTRRANTARNSALLASALALGSAATVFAAPPACPPGPACPGGKQYCVPHKFKLVPTGGHVFDLVSAAWQPSGLARVRCDGVEVKDIMASGAVVLVGPGMVGPRTAGPVGCGNSCAVANSAIQVDSLTGALVSGTMFAYGSVLAQAGPPPVNTSAFAKSAGALGVKGGTMMRDGSIDWSPQTTVTVSGQRWAGSGPAYKDPIIARRTDLTTGITTSYTLLSIDAYTMNDDLTWADDMLFSKSSNFRFRITMTSPWTVQQGTLDFEVEGGVVTTSTRTGVFAGIFLPPVGAPGEDVSLAIPNDIHLDYDMGGSDTDNLATELDFSQGGEAPDADARLPLYCTTNFTVPVSGSYVTDLGDGFSNADLSQPTPPTAPLGYNVNISQVHVAEDFTIPAGQLWHPTALELPLFDPGTSPGMPLAAVSVRLWMGTPGAGGIPIAGDPFSNRLVATNFEDAYRVATNPLDQQNAIKDAWVDLNWLPTLGQGTYWLEIGAAGANPNLGPFIVPVTDVANVDNARLLNMQTQQWTALTNPQTSHAVSLPYTLYGTGFPRPCQGDLNGDNQVDLSDLAIVIGQYGCNGSCSADLNLDGHVDLTDLAIELSAYGHMCQH